MAIEDGEEYDFYRLSSLLAHGYGDGRMVPQQLFHPRPHHRLITLVDPKVHSRRALPRTLARMLRPRIQYRPKACVLRRDTGSHCHGCRVYHSSILAAGAYV